MGRLEPRAQMHPTYMLGDPSSSGDPVNLHHKYDLHHKSWADGCHLHPVDGHYLSYGGWPLVVHDPGASSQDPDIEDVTDHE